MEKKKIDKNRAKEVGDQLKVNWQKVDLNEFWMGLNVELEHGEKYPETDVTSEAPDLTSNDIYEVAKIALAHLIELPDYYTRLKQMEEEGKKAHPQETDPSELFQQQASNWFKKALEG